MAGSIGIRCRNNTAVICQLHSRTHGAKTDLGVRKAVIDSSTWSYDELIAAGLKKGANCWVSVAIIAGVANHESGSNFTLQKDASFTLVYTLSSGAATPSQTFTELSGYGFNKRDDCWLSVDVEAGRANHESGENFALRKNTPVIANYTLLDTIWFPSWSQGADKPWTKDGNR
ncbi:unnamed protein product [Clonostachys rhizophaga]|uniref:Uncharacterized protein n=1 Tax=Clonostachys rhizophaga TaxID=160324 RepID=A0A9N9W3L1_9HYPO|nr:unnamed protein product [Clonostachys rhizophaga]